MSKVQGDTFNTAKEYVERESIYINDIVKSLVKRYSRELDDFVIVVQDALQMVKEGTMQVYDTDMLEMQSLKLPTLLYFAGDGLEILGAESDVAESRRKELYNEIIASLDTKEYTIPDKKAEAEAKTEAELMIKEIYDRSYKQLKLKIEHASRLLESMKKVMEVRIAKINKGKGWDKGGEIQ